MKVIYVAHFNEGSGYTKAAEGYVKSLLSVGVDVVCRSISLNSSTSPAADWLIPLLAKNTDGATHVIQHVLPHHMSYCEGKKNIGLCVYDLSSLRYCEWDIYLDTLDEVWLPNAVNSSLLQELDNVTAIIPHANSIEKYHRSYDKLPIPELGGTCVFYTIAELNKRKNLLDTIIAFHSAFHVNEPVSLVIKTSKFGLSPEQCADVVKNDINHIKENLKLYPSVSDYKSEVLITHRITDEQMMSIHESGYCYVSTSRGEMFNLPLYDSWAIGNRNVYYTDNYMYDYMKYSTGTDASPLSFPVYCKKEPCFGYSDTFPQIGSSRESWLSSNIPDLITQMRTVYEIWKTRPEKIKHNASEKYSYENVGKMMLEQLNK